MKNLVSSIQGFFRLESAGGIAIILSVIASLIVANSPLYGVYHHFIHSDFKLSLLGFSLDKDLHFFVNDILLSVFFLTIAIELKREMISGELRNPKNLILPIASAIGGVIFPVLIYLYFNHDQSTNGGWAIPGATDIAIAFGVLLIIGSKVPSSLKIYLLSLAIIDDVIVIGIIAFFFSNDINLYYLGCAAGVTALLLLLQHKGVSNFAPFAVLGVFLWVFVYQSGIHATIAGVILGLTIPAKERYRYDESGKPVEKRKSMLESIEHSMHETVSFFILPLFAFVNAGVKISMDDFNNLTSPVSLGIIFGLVLGKQIGVFLFSFIVIKTKIAPMPSNANWLQMYAVAALCGIGFTMGLFIGELSFMNTDIQYKLPILVGSTLSALLGFALMKISLANNSNKKATA